MIDHEYHDIETGECLFESDLEDRYAAMIDDVYGAVTVAGLDFDASSVIRNMDPIAYRCGMIDWLDSENGETISDDAECPEDEDDIDIDIIDTRTHDELGITGDDERDENRCGEFDTHEFSTGWDPECVRCGAAGYTG